MQRNGAKRTHKVVGIDPSYTCTGIAYADGSTQPIRTRSEQEDRIRRKRIVAAITTAAWEADLVVIEGYSYGSSQGREKLGALGEAVRDALGDIDIPHVAIAPPTLKKWATGAGNASKALVKEAAVELLGLSPKATHDEADALWLRQAGLFLLGDTATAYLPPTDRSAALAAVELPEGIQ